MIAMNLGCDKYLVCKHFGKIQDVTCLFCRNEKGFEPKERKTGVSR